MADYEQVSSVNIKAMGKRKGWCLQNCRLVFGFTIGKYASAKVDMESQRAGGTLHSIDTLPTNVVVPVYVDTTSKYEHVVISYYGTFYEDGYRISRNKYSRYFGWGELCDGRRVVKVTTLKSFLPSKGYWAYGDNDERVGHLADFMYATFPKYSPKGVHLGILVLTVCLPFVVESTTCGLFLLESKRWSNFTRSVLEL